jgi:hypothetical protein
LYPHERSLVKKLAGKPFVLLGINSDKDRNELKQTLIDEEITWRSWWDQSVDGPIHTEWQIELRPAIHLIDAKGVIRYKEIDASEVDQAIDELLAELAAEGE